MKRFNVRVYGLWMEDHKVLVSDELIRGKQIIKFPGGGLEWGEGTADCLKRELREELDTDIEILSHFYTTDFFQPSAWDDSQVISIYYLFRPLRIPILPYKNGREHFYFLPVTPALPGEITLPIDKIVAGKLHHFLSDAATRNEIF